MTLLTKLRDSYTRALAASVIFTSLAIALTGGALMNAGETAKIADAGTVGTYAAPAPMRLIPEDPEEYTGSSAELIMSSEFRARNVWEDSTYGFYSDFDNLFSDQLIKAIDRNAGHASAMRMGNFLTFTASDLVINAVEFDPLSQVGVTIDIVGDKIFKAITGNNTTTGVVLLSILAVAIVLTALFQAVRGQNMGILLRRTAGMTMVLALLFFMGSAALSRDEQALGMTNSADYQSTPGTPLWMAQFVNKWMGKVSATVTDGFIALYDSIDSANIAAAGGGAFSCAQYVKAMNQNFQEQVDLYAPDNNVVSITRVMDQIWNMTGLDTWKDAQFGTRSTYGDKTWCHVLNVDSHVPYPTLEANFAQLAENQGFDWEDYKAAQNSDTNNGQPQEQSSGLPGGNQYPTMAFRHPNGAENDVTHLGWAICQAEITGGGWTWKLEPGWQRWKGEGDVELDDSNITRMCDVWWRFRDDTMPKPENSSFEEDAPDEFETSASHAIEHGAKASDYVAVQDFVGHLTGASASSSGAAANGYAAGSIGTFIAYGFVSLITYAAKVFSTVFTIAFWFVVLAALFSSRPFAAVIGKSFSKFLGITLVATMVTALLALVVVIASVLMSIGRALFGEGTLMTMLWIGLSPALALLVLNFIFKKAFKVPSPLSISGAHAWGKAGLSGAAGYAAGSVTAGLGRRALSMARNTGAQLSRTGRSQLRDVARRGAGTVGSSRRSAMDAERAGKLTPTGRESASRHAVLERGRERDENGRLVGVSFAMDKAGRKELRHNRAEDEAARRQQDVQKLRDLKADLKAGGHSRAEIRANMRMARMNMNAERKDRREELGLGIRERMRVRALRATARPSESINEALNSAARRITQGGGELGMDSRVTRFANTRVGARVTQAAHMRAARADMLDGRPAVPAWRQRAEGTTRVDRDLARAEQRRQAREHAEARSEAHADRLLERAASSNSKRELRGAARAYERLESAQGAADQRERLREASARTAAKYAALSGAPGANEAYARQQEQELRAQKRAERRAADNQARRELIDERRNEIDNR